MKNELQLDLNTNFETVPGFSFPSFSDLLPNAVIEGENLSALYFLNKLPQAEGGIDFMYWDPPYNTGSKGFYYDDDRSATENGESPGTRYIRGRMEYARYQLKETGCIAVHIDERELRRLWQIMDKVFKSKNF